MSGKRNILLIRHQRAAKRTRDALKNHGHECIIMPLSKIEILSNGLPEGGFSAVIVTSPVASRILTGHFSGQTLIKLPVYCVGEATAGCVRQAGFANIAEIATDAEDLLKSLAIFKPGSRLLYPCAKHRSFDFAGQLKKKGIACVRWEIYVNQLVTPVGTQIADGLAETNTILLFSKRTAEHFFKLADAAGGNELSLANHLIVAISPNVAAAVPRKLQSNTYIAREKNETSMIDCVDTLGGQV